MRWELSSPAIERLLRLQSGMVARSQLLAAGASAKDVERWVRRRELTPIHTGVYAAHTGALSVLQRKWAAVLAAWPAALAGESALDWPRAGGLLVAVDASRRVRDVPGVTFVRMRGLRAQVVWATEPPRVRPEYAALAIASQRLGADDVAGAFGALARARSEGWATASRLESAVADLRAVPRLHGRAILRAMIADLRAGTHSVLERGYLELVERAHGLPAGTRQAQGAAGGRRTFQDVRYDPYGVVVELDGWAFHRDRRDADADRDLDALAQRGDITVRLTSVQVHRDPCRTAVRIAQVLRQRGWAGEARGCPRCR